MAARPGARARLGPALSGTGREMGGAGMKQESDHINQLTARSATRTPEARGLERVEVRLLVSGRDGHEHAVFHELADFLPAETPLLVKASATLPASRPACRPPAPLPPHLPSCPTPC